MNRGIAVLFAICSTLGCGIAFGQGAILGGILLALTAIGGVVWATRDGK